MAEKPRYPKKICTNCYYAGYIGSKCPSCKAATMIPTKSPRGQSLMLQTYGTDYFKSPQEDYIIQAPKLLYLNGILFILYALTLSYKGNLIGSLFILFAGMLGIPIIRNAFYSIFGPIKFTTLNGYIFSLAAIGVLTTNPYGIFDRKPDTNSLSEKYVPEDRTITDPYYFLISDPSLTKKERQLFKCLKADSVIEKYAAKGDEYNAKQWRDQKERDCTRYREMTEE